MTYSSYLSVGRSRYSSRNQNAVAVKAKRGLGPISNSVILIVLSCLLGLLYLTQVTKTNAFGYKINELQSQQSTLQTEHEELEVAAARLQALERVKNSPIANSLVSVAPSASIQN